MGEAKAKKIAIDKMRVEREKILKLQLKKEVRGLLFETVFPSGLEGHIDIALKINRTAVALEVLKELYDEFSKPV